MSDRKKSWHSAYDTGIEPSSSRFVFREYCLHIVDADFVVLILRKTHNGYQVQAHLRRGENVLRADVYWDEGTGWQALVTTAKKKLMERFT